MFVITGAIAAAALFGGSALSSQQQPGSTTVACTTLPTSAEVGFNSSYRRSFMSRAAAIRASIPVASFSATGDEMLLVQDYGSFRECVGTDGRTIVQYGRSIRTIITMATADAEAGMTFPAIAASATIRNRRNSVQIEIRGFSNPAMTLAASQITGKELNVETFAQFSAVQEQLVALSAAPETQKSVERLGSIAPAERTEIASVAIVTLALQQISLGASCNYAKTRLRTVPASEPQPDVARLAATYVDLTGVCSDARPSSLQQVSARQHLYGMRIQ